MLIKQIVETELQQLLPVEDQAKALYLDGKWPKLFQTNTVEDILRLRQQGEFPGQDVLPPIRLSSKASMFYSEFDIDIKRTLRYNLGCVHSHSYYELLYLSHGQCTQVVNGVTLDVKEGDLVILAPNSSHDYQILDDNTISLTVSMGMQAFQKMFFHLFDNNAALCSFFSRTLSDRIQCPI